MNGLEEVVKHLTPSATVCPVADILVRSEYLPVVSGINIGSITPIISIKPVPDASAGVGRVIGAVDGTLPVDCLPLPLVWIDAGGWYIAVAIVRTRAKVLFPDRNTGESVAGSGDQVTAVVCNTSCGDLGQRVVDVAEGLRTGGRSHGWLVVVVVGDLADPVDEVVVIIASMLDRLVSPEVVRGPPMVSPTPETVGRSPLNVQRAVRPGNRLCHAGHSRPQVAQKELEIVKVALAASLSPPARHPIAYTFGLVVIPVAALITNLAVCLGILLIDEIGLKQPNPLEAVLVPPCPHRCDEEGKSKGKRDLHDVGLSWWCC